jgi:hypothetical protein
VKDNTGPGRDLITWTWKRGEATSKIEFGDPTVAATHDLCIYDESAGVPSLILDLHVPAGAAWEESSAGYDYSDPSGAVGGLHRVSFRGSLIDGRSRIKVNLKGAALTLPSLPLDQDDRVTVQLVGQNACWGAAYSSATSDLSSRFRAKSD